MLHLKSRMRIRSNEVQHVRERTSSKIKLGKNAMRPSREGFQSQATNANTAGGNLLLLWWRQIAQAARAEAAEDDGDGKHGEQQRGVGARHQHAAPEVKALRIARDGYHRLVGRQAQHGGAGQVERMGLPPCSQLLSALRSVCLQQHGNSTLCQHMHQALNMVYQVGKCRTSNLGVRLNLDVGNIVDEESACQHYCAGHYREHQQKGDCIRVQE